MVGMNGGVQYAIDAVVIMACLFLYIPVLEAGTGFANCLCRCWTLEHGNLNMNKIAYNVCRSSVVGPLGPARIPQNVCTRWTDRIEQENRIAFAAAPL